MSHRTGVAPTKHYLVARCPCCLRPLWPRQMAALLGFDPMAATRLVTQEVAFVAETRQHKGGWHLLRSLRAISDVRAISTEAVDQLRRLARQTLDRLWERGLIQRADLDALIYERRVSAPPAVARETASIASVAGAISRNSGYQTSREDLKW